ncbi:MAG: nitroreductase family deazaflavin-dependent oxidoreductase [Solirubrobacteraceae bacterium]
MALKLSRRVARFNRAVTNPIQSQYAWLLPPWVVICHRGRRSGRRYRTPVNAFRSGSTLVVVMLYGEESDWVRNVLAAGAGGAQVVRAGRTHDLLDAQVVDPTHVLGLPLAAAAFGRLTGLALLARLGPARPGFGRGPAASA